MAARNSLLHEEFKGCEDSYDSGKDILEDLFNIGFYKYVSGVDWFYPFVSLVSREAFCMWLVSVTRSLLQR